jgi:hypothetical protein
MASDGRPFITNHVPFAEMPLGKDGRFTRPWHDFFQGLAQSAADAVLVFRNSDLVGSQAGATSGDMAAQTVMMVMGTASSDSESGGFVPVFIPSGETFTVPEDKQALFAMTIDNEGTLVVDGYLVQVN